MRAFVKFFDYPLVVPPAPQRGRMPLAQGIALGKAVRSPRPKGAKAPYFAMCFFAFAPLGRAHSSLNTQGAALG